MLPDQPFKIYCLSAKDAEEIAKTPNEPHLHTYEELLIGMSGTLEHFIDFRSTIIDAPYVSFVTKGKVHRARPGIKDGLCDIWVVRFMSEFIPETTFQLYANYHDHANLPMYSGAAFSRIVTLCEMMAEEMKQDPPDLAVVRHLLNALFMKIESERRKVAENEEPQQRMQSITFKNFLRILEENYRRPEGVEYYAEKLFMSSRNLNLICQNILQQSVSEIIETRKLIEAKNLLITTDKTVAEIGFDLGYNEKSYFTNVFKKKAGQTPKEFREEMRKLVS